MDCCICLDNLNNDYIKLNCNHIFHNQCILQNEYISNKKLCPLCRQIYTADARILEIIKSENEYNKIMNIKNKYLNFKINDIQIYSFEYS